VMWSWCGQVSSASAGDIKLYLRLMSELEEQFPGYVFIYMTGHLDGSGENGNLNHRNNQIREFCKVNGKILYDFADILQFSRQNRNDTSLSSLFYISTIDIAASHVQSLPVHWEQVHHSYLAPPVLVHIR